MGAIEKLGQQQKEAERAENPEIAGEVEIKGPTVKEILDDKKLSEFFSLYLQEEGADDLGLKLSKRELGREEIEELNEKRRGFLEVMERSKNVDEVLNPATLKSIIDSSPEMKMIAEVHGPEGIRNAVKRYLPHMAILDRERFKDLSERAVALGETKKTIAEENKKIEKLCKEYGIDEKKYVEILQKGEDGRKEMAELVAGKLGFWKAAFTSTEKIREKIDELDKADAAQEYLDKLNADLVGVAGALETTLMDNEMVRAALSADLFHGEAPKLEKDIAFSEVKKMTDEDLENAGEMFDQWLKDQSLDADGIPDERYQQEVNKFSQNYFSNGKKGRKGFWETIRENMNRPKLKASLKRKKQP